jgi:hypothetical protein
MGERQSQSEAARQRGSEAEREREREREREKTATGALDAHRARWEGEKRTSINQVCGAPPSRPRARCCGALLVLQLQQQLLLQCH